MSQWANTQRERERASSAPSGVVGDSLLPSENHEAIPCIERAPRTVDDGSRGDGIGARSSGRELAPGSVRDEGTVRVNMRKPERPRERERERERVSVQTRGSRQGRRYAPCTFSYEHYGESARSRHIGRR